MIMAITGGDGGFVTTVVLLTAWTAGGRRRQTGIDKKRIL